jgi:hypothetical protein
VSSRLTTVAWTTAAAAITFGSVAGAGSAGRQGTAFWSEARAETMIRSAPPAIWVRRGWDVVLADCSGLGTGRLRGSRQVYRNFSCEIVLVRQTSDCPWSGDYVCVAGFESSTRARTLHVIGSKRYALYRI